MRRSAMFADIQDILRKEFKGNNADLEALIDCQERDFPITLRVSRINGRFLKLICSVWKDHVGQLQATYIEVSKEIEISRQLALSTSVANSPQLEQINNSHDKHHHLLINNVETSLHALERNLAEGCNDFEPQSANAHTPSDFKSRCSKGIEEHLKRRHRKEQRMPYHRELSWKQLREQYSSCSDQSRWLTQVSSLVPDCKTMTYCKMV